MTRSILLAGDARQALVNIPDASVDCIITSPPYYGHRDYHIPPSTFGDHPNCRHQWLPPMRSRGQSGGLSGSTLTGTQPGAERRPTWESTFCSACGSWCGNLGLEPTPELFIEHLADICDQLLRVLAHDGTFWLNIADSYAGTIKSAIPKVYPQHIKALAQPQGFQHPKNLIGVPWKLIAKLQQQGWILRTDVIWHRRNAPPQSQTDRPSRSHEYIFLLSKSHTYRYNNTAVPEYAQNGAARNLRTIWDIPVVSFPNSHTAPFPETLPKMMLLASSSPGHTVLDPFSGSGTTGAVAVSNGRNFIGIEPHIGYLKESRLRIADAYPYHSKDCNT